jgi:TRAP-type mannitol/chloroaromatic compound transport system permease small subunit
MAQANTSPLPGADVARAAAPAAGPAERFLRAIDSISYWSGKTFAWLIVVLMLTVAIEVFKRYILNAPTAWIFDLNNMLYGTLFMLCGAYALAQNAHVRADFIYIHLRPRAQAALDLALYLLFFVPGILALIYAGYGYAAESWQINEHSTVTADGPPIYHFKAMIPLAGLLVMVQGVAEIVRCCVCLRTGSWPARLADVEEIDVVEEQLAHSQFVDAESRQAAAGSAHAIDEAARQRKGGSPGAEKSPKVP